MTAITAKDTSGAPEHLLLTVLGTATAEARYALNGKETSACLAPIAVIDLLSDAERPHRVLALCTAEAKRESWPRLAHALAGCCAVQPVDIPSGGAQEDVDIFLTTIAEAIPEGADLTVDVTHGFRHFSFLTYVGVLYLAPLRRVTIRGAYYGLLKQKPELSPFLDLRPLLALPRWVHALEVLRETGSALPMAEILRNGPSSQSARRCASDLTELSAAYLSGLPLELGWQARSIREQRRKPLRRLLEEHRLPLAGNLTDLLAVVLKPFAITNAVSGKGWKRDIRLSEEELRRQARLIDGLMQHGSFAAAFGLMSEWTVSWVAWVRGDAGSGWLDYHTIRTSAASLLGAMAAAAADSDLRDTLTEEQHALGAFWRQLTELRNGYAHHGMRPQQLVNDQKVSRAQGVIRKYWDETLKAIPTFPLSIGGSPGGRVLVSPIGLRPGVLFSALQACRADGTGREPVLSLVICSHETKEMIEDALQHAAYAGKVEPLLLEDAFGGGSEEIERLAQAARGHVIGAREIFVNITGGTTLMGLVAEKVADAARALACPVRRFGLIDRRSPDEQEADPYQAGEPFWLDGEQG